MSDQPTRATTATQGSEPLGHMRSLLGLAVIESDHVPQGTYYLLPNAVMMNWIDRSMLAFDHAQWWAETPAQTARRIVNEVLTHHGFEADQPITTQEDGDV